MTQIAVVDGGFEGASTAPTVEPRAAPIEGVLVTRFGVGVLGGEIPECDNSEECPCCNRDAELMGTPAMYPDVRLRPRIFGPTLPSQPPPRQAPIRLVATLFRNGSRGTGSARPTIRTTQMPHLSSSWRCRSPTPGHSHGQFLPSISLSRSPPLCMARATLDRRCLSISDSGLCARCAYYFRGRRQASRKDIHSRRPSPIWPHGRRRPRYSSKSSLYGAQDYRHAAHGWFDGAVADGFAFGEWNHHDFDHPVTGVLRVIVRFAQTYQDGDVAVSFDGLRVIGQPSAPSPASAGSWTLEASPPESCAAILFRAQERGDPPPADGAYWIQPRDGFESPIRVRCDMARGGRLVFQVRARADLCRVGRTALRAPLTRHGDFPSHSSGVWTARSTFGATGTPTCAALVTQRASIGSAWKTSTS